MSIGSAIVRLACAAALAAGGSAARAQEFSENLDDPSAFRTVIPAREYDDRFETVAELLDHAPGVRVRQLGGPGAASTVQIRGAKSEQVLVLLDGVRLDSAARGGVDLSTLPLRTVETIEVLRGGGAARYGSDAVGGVISIRTRRPEPGAGLDLSLTTGSNETSGGDGFVSLGSERLAGVVGYTNLGGENDYEFERSNARGETVTNTRLGAQFREQSGLARGEWQPREDTLVSATLHAFGADRGQPGYVRGKPLDAPDEVVSCTSADERLGRVVGRVSLDHRFESSGTLEAALSYRDERYDVHDHWRRPDSGVPELVGCDYLDPLVVDEDRASLRESESAGELGYAGTTWYLGPLELTPRSTLALRFEGAEGDDLSGVDRQVGTFFLQQEFALFDRRLRLFPALGVDAARTGSTTVLAPGTAASLDLPSESDLEWLPRIGALLEITPSLRLKGNLSRGFRRPNFTELFHPDLGFVSGNPALSPEKSTSWDVGLEGALPPLGPLSRLSFEVAYFGRDLEDPIEWVDESSRRLRPRNLDDATVRGVELQLSGRLRRLELAGSYTFMDSEQQVPGPRLPRVDPSPPLPHTPRNRSFVSATLPVGPLRPFAELEYVDSFTLNQAGRLRAPETTQIDLGVSLFLHELPGLRWLPRSFSATLELQNATDETIVDSIGLPLPGRLWYLRLRSAAR